MEKLGLEQLVTIFFLLCNLVDATRMARMATVSTAILTWLTSSKNERIINFLQVFRLQAIAIPL